jgi:hypothetical protein
MPRKWKLENAPVRETLLARTQLRRDLNYVIVSWNGMIAGN